MNYDEVEAEIGRAFELLDHSNDTPPAQLREAADIIEAALAAADYPYETYETYPMERVVANLRQTAIIREMSA